MLANTGTPIKEIVFEYNFYDESQKKILLLLLMNYGVSAFAIHFTEHILFTAKLGGAEMVPPVVGQASGVSAFTLNPTRDSIAVNACFNQLSSAITQVAIYRGEAGTNGEMVLELSAYVGNNVLNTFLLLIFYQII
ncbi:MAG: CHRD domain-containing protein [Bacteroidetes bacterium]|nr:CHRD domain-containing protein [Bacteroidota bacterium]